MIGLGSDAAGAAVQVVPPTSDGARLSRLPNGRNARDRSARTNAVIQSVVAKLLGNRLVVNHLRGSVVEAIVAQALSPDWHWCSEDWGGWDFERTDGLKLEVKQSAALQTWAGTGKPPSRASFDIAIRKGRYTGDAAWVDRVGRWADIYVFAHHALTDETADHRDPSQWTFYVTPTIALPTTSTIGLSAVQRLSVRCGVDELLTVIEETTARLR